MVITSFVFLDIFSGNSKCLHLPLMLALIKLGFLRVVFFFKKDMTYDKIKSHKKPECHLSIILSRRSN